MKKILSTRVLVKICVLTTILLVLIIYTIWGNSALMVSMVNISSDRIASAFSNFRITYIFKNLNLAVLGMLLLIAFRCVVSQIYCSKMLNIEYKSSLLGLSVGIVIYLVCGTILSDLVGSILMFTWIMIYIYINIPNIKKAAIILLYNRN